MSTPGPIHPVAAVVLNYRTAESTRTAVRSLLASTHPPDHVVVVDNDDPQFAGDALQPGSESCGAPLQPSSRAAAERVALVRTGANLGFSGGINAGIRVALRRNADAVLLVNSDATLTPACIERLESVLFSDPAIGVVGPAIVTSQSGSAQTSGGIAYDSLTGRMKHVRIAAAAGDRGTGNSDPVDAVSGCVMMVKREVLGAIGGFDEDYFYSFEDIDFCLRARAAGFRSVVVRDALAHHQGSVSIGATSTRRLYFAARNHLLLASRVTPARTRAGHLGRACFIVMLNLMHAARSSGASMRERIGSVARGTGHYLAGRYGTDS